VFGSAAVAAAAKFIDESKVSGLPAEYRTDFRRRRCLVEKQHLGEILAEPRARLLFGPWDRPRSSYRDSSSFCQFRDGGAQAVADYVFASGVAVLQGETEDGR
jgi:hypothetical protein